MRFMLLVKATKDSEAGVMPTKSLLNNMTKFNQELAKAGVLLDLDGLQPSSKGARVTFNRGKTTVIDGPFAEAKELVAGFWLIQTKSKEEAVEWARRAPMTDDQFPEAQIEIRQLFELDDLGEFEAKADSRELQRTIAKNRN